MCKYLCVPSVQVRGWLSGAVSSHPVGTKDGTQVLRHGSRHLYPLTHPCSPMFPLLPDVPTELCPVGAASFSSRQGLGIKPKAISPVPVVYYTLSPSLSLCLTLSFSLCLSVSLCVSVCVSRGIHTCMHTHWCVHMCMHTHWCVWRAEVFLPNVL